MLCCFPLLLYKCAVIPRRLSIISDCKRGKASKRVRVCTASRHSLSEVGAGSCNLWWLELQALAVLSGLRKLFPPLCAGEHFYIQSLLYADMNSQPDTHKSKPTHGSGKKKKKRQHDSLHKQACWTPLGGGAAVRRSCSIMKHICSLITKAKVVGLAASTYMALGYDLCLKCRHKNTKKPPPLFKSGTAGTLKKK